MEAAIERFVALLRPDAVALFHFSGHGMQVDQENYLVPVDFQLTDEASVKYDAYPASKLHDRMASAGGRLNIVILDACRNNGFSTSRSGASGLAAMNAARGSFIAFATAPGSTASDNPRGRNGLFTSYLLEALQAPGLKLDEVFNQVREGVFVSSNKKQLAWTSSSVIGDFYFAPGAKSDRDLVYVKADDQTPDNTAGGVQAAKQLPPPEPPGPSLDVVRESLIMLGARAGAVKSSIERLRSQQAAQGVSLRGDMAASLDRMEFFLGEAEASLNNSDAQRAERNISLADREVTKLEKFLGR
jgi:hypothetical protein